MAAPEQYRAVLLGSGDPESGGGGSTIREILTASALGIISVRVDAVICNNSESKVPGFYSGIEDLNQEFGTNVRVFTVNGHRYKAAEEEMVERGSQTVAEGQACADIMAEVDADIYVQAGFMKRTVGAMLERNGINTHPGPLEIPKDTTGHNYPRGVEGVDTKGFHGIEVQEFVLAQGYPYSAHTVHTVTAEYDSGEITAWRPVLVRPGDTAEGLFDRVQHVEKACLPYDIEAYAASLAD